jgi:hypothetical protein
MSIREEDKEVISEKLMYFYDNKSDKKYLYLLVTINNEKAK